MLLERLKNIRGLDCEGYVYISKLNRLGGLSCT
jgi:hypothetical protein